MNRVTRAMAVLLMAAAGACGDESAPADAGTDAGGADAGGADAGSAASDGAGADVEQRNGCPVLRDPVGREGEAPMGDTWAGFARPLFARVCTRCHSSTLTDPFARNGAPTGYNWDLEASVRMQLPRIRNAIGVENNMPIGEPELTCTERRRVVRWIDIGAP